MKRNTKVYEKRQKRRRRLTKRERDRIFSENLVDFTPYWRWRVASHAALVRGSRQRSGDSSGQRNYGNPERLRRLKRKRERERRL